MLAQVEKTAEDRNHAPPTRNVSVRVTFVSCTIADTSLKLGLLVSPFVPAVRDARRSRMRRIARWKDVTFFALPREQPRAGSQISYHLELVPPSSALPPVGVGRCSTSSVRLASAARHASHPSAVSTRSLDRFHGFQL